MNFPYNFKEIVSKHIEAIIPANAFLATKEELGEKIY